MEDSFSLNVKGVSDLVENPTNKQSQGALGDEGATGDRMDILDLPMPDEELLDLRDQYEREYAPYESKIKPIFSRNLNSYLGRTKDGRLLESDEIGAANLQFESEETFLPAAMSRNPDPLVYCDNTPEGNTLANDVKAMLQYHADELLLKRRLAVMTRQWSIYQLGVLKYGWSNKKNDITLDGRKIQNFIFDPNGYVDVYGNFTSWMGERITVTAEVLADTFPDKRKYIEITVGGKMGTEVTYTEWWTDEFCFSTYKDIVLDKHKNEFFNYDEPDEYDELGLPIASQVVKNHFEYPKKPYTFLSVFSLQEKPHDITGLIEQNIPNQAKVTKRTEQIDSNISQSNNSTAFSERNFDQETAKQASDAMTKGVGKVLIPEGGPINEAIIRIPAPSFPDAGFKDLQNSEEHLRSSWGVQGISSQAPSPSETARGMIISQGRDTSRIGGGISDIIEQSVARSVYNWFVQLYHVFYDESHMASIMGTNKAVQHVILNANSFNRKVIVTVSPNSMRPKDEISQINLAQTLFDKGAIGPKTLLEMVNFPDPEEAAADGVLWQVDKMAYMQLNFPDLVARIAQVQAPPPPQPTAPMIPAQSPGQISNIPLPQ